MDKTFNIGGKEVRVWQFVALVFLLITVPLGVYLVQTTQIFKPKADSQPGAWVDAFEIKDANGNPIICDTSKNPPECTTGTADVNIKVKDASKLQ